MSWWQTIVLAVLQGLTEFLPVSSSGHLAIASRVFFAGDAGASFTAVMTTVELPVAVSAPPLPWPPALPSLKVQAS